MIRWQGRCQTNVRAKLTPEKRDEILANPHHLTVRELAMRFGVSVSCISRVRRGVTWAEHPAERNYNAKLELGDADAIRMFFAAGYPGEQVAEKFGVSRATVSQIVNERTWKDT